jgi:hypothetical protein
MVLWGKGHAAALQVSNNAQWVIPLDQIVTVVVDTDAAFCELLTACAPKAEAIMNTSPTLM